MGYHANCYKAFTAIKSIPNAENRHDSKQSTRRLSVGDDTSSTSGIFPDKCIFCDSKSKKTHSSREFLTNCPRRQQHCPSPYGAPPWSVPWGKPVLQGERHAVACPQQEGSVGDDVVTDYVWHAIGKRRLGYPHQAQGHHRPQHDDNWH